LGAIFTQSAHRGRGHARRLIEQMLELAAADDVDLALLFSEIGADYYVRLGFQAMPVPDQTLRVTESVRHGAPATLVRAAEDRDPAGARVGAILQALIARDPAEARPAITAWLPPGFCPPQVTMVERRPASEVMMIRPLSARAKAARPIAAADVLYWRGDMF